jgi:hypothetical protein
VKGLVPGRRQDPVDPGALVDGARLGERGAAELLGVEAEGRLLGGVPADGQGASDRLCNEFVPKTAFVLEVVIGHSAASSLIVV